jgi:glycosyltransferase involved in cell wall biosynthesis
MPLFSVIVPTYARPGFLSEALQSVLAQTVDDFECIVVDDASPEPASVPGDPRIRLVRRSSNGGPAAARNTGLHVARGRYVAFLDDDDLFTPDRLAVALEGLRRAPVSVCWIRYLHTTVGSNRTLTGDVRHEILDSRVPHLGTVAVERAVVPAFDERFIACEDTEWWLRLAHQAQVATVPRIGCLFRLHWMPRHLITVSARIEGRFLMLRLYEPYFEQHRQAAAFQWKRIGRLSAMHGDYGLARKAFARAFALSPEFRTIMQLAGAFHWSTPIPDEKVPPPAWDP